MHRHFISFRHQNLAQIITSTCLASIEQSRTTTTSSYVYVFRYKEVEEEKEKEEVEADEGGNIKQKQAPESRLSFSVLHPVVSYVSAVVSRGSLIVPRLFI